MLKKIIVAVTTLVGLGVIGSAVYRKVQSA